MRASVLILSLLILVGAAPPPDAPPTVTLKRAIALDGVVGRIDHLTYDPTTKRLFVAALGNGSLEAIDLEKGERVKSVSGLKEPQGIVYVPATRQIIVACGGDGTVRAFDAATLEEKLKVDLGDDADNVRLSPGGQAVVVGYGSGALAILDAATLRRTGEIVLPGHPESFQIEPGENGGGRFYVNIPGSGTGGGGVVVADLASAKTLATWRPKDAGRNFPMALDAASKRLYIGCRRPAKLLVLDTTDGKIIASLDCVGDADEIFVTPDGATVLMTGGDGGIEVITTRDHALYVRTALVQTASGARTGLFVPERRALYVAVPRRSEQAAAIREYELSQ